MARVFLSHSSADNAAAVALRDWLIAEGWDDLFLDLDPQRGIVAGERWERALNEAANRCEAVLFLVSKAWLASAWCLKEFHLASRLNKRMFGLLIEDLSIESLPAEVTATWQLVDLASGRDHQMFQVELPDGDEAHVTYSRSGLARLKAGLTKAGLDARFFAWPPAGEPDRPPYRGLKPLEAEDAGIFFGREAPTIETLDRLRGLSEGAPPRILVILGASGAGKSSFLRAGLVPRLQRDDRTFLPLPIVRPDRAAITGETGLLPALEAACRTAGLKCSRAAIKAALDDGPVAVAALLDALAEAAAVHEVGEVPGARPWLVLAVDQGEELFLVEGAEEARAFLDLVRDLATAAESKLIVLFTIRSDAYEYLQAAPALDGLHQHILSLPPLPRGAYQTVIEGPAARLRDTEQALTIEPALTEALLADIEKGGAKDALPLLAFTLQRLYLEHGGDGDLNLDEYRQLGGIRGSIEAAVENALKQADGDSAVPKDRAARLALLRRALIPWLCGIDPETGAPRRRVARLSEIPEEARPLVEHLIAARLLATDVSNDTSERTIEPAHEALLRQWGLLQGWLEEDFAALAALEGVKRSARDWDANHRNEAWLVHTGDRLQVAASLSKRPDFVASLGQTERSYLSACRTNERKAIGYRRRTRVLVGLLFLLLAGAGVGWWMQDTLRERFRWYAFMGPSELTSSEEKVLKPGDAFLECTGGCPTMVVVPPGAFMMGSDGRGRAGDDQSPTIPPDSQLPQHPVTIPGPFAVSRFEITKKEWDACVANGPCDPRYSERLDDGHPVSDLAWSDAREYADWLARITGKPYRLLSEAEWEYAARAGTQTLYFWGDEIGRGNAHCDGCYGSGSARATDTVGDYAPNAFGLHDMHGNALEWVLDCVHATYEGAPSDGSAWTEQDCATHVVRGGAWYMKPELLASAERFWTTTYLDFSGGVRIARDLSR